MTRKLLLITVWIEVICNPLLTVCLPAYFWSLLLLLFQHRAFGIVSQIQLRIIDGVQYWSVANAAITFVVLEFKMIEFVCSLFQKPEEIIELY